LGVFSSGFCAQSGLPARQQSQAVGFGRLAARIAACQVMNQTDPRKSCLAALKARRSSLKNESSFASNPNDPCCYAKDFYE